MGFPDHTNMKPIADMEIENSMKNAPLKSMKTVLLVDDDAESLIMLQWFLSILGYAVDSAKNAEEGLAVFDPKIHDIVVTDNRMPGMSGLEMSQVIKQRSQNTPVLMYTGRPPVNATWVDLMITRPAHLLVLEEGVAKLLHEKSKQQFKKAEISKHDITKSGEQ